MKLPMRNVSRATPGNGVGMLTKGRKSPLSPTESRALLATPARSFGAPAAPPAWLREKAAEAEVSRVLTGGNWTGRRARRVTCPSCFLVVASTTGSCSCSEVSDAGMRKAVVA